VAKQMGYVFDGITGKGEYVEIDLPETEETN